MMRAGVAPRAAAVARPTSAEAKVRRAARGKVPACRTEAKKPRKA